MADTKTVAAEQRHSFIKALVKEHYGREATSIETLGRDSNNWVYLISLSEASALPSKITSSYEPKPGTTVLQETTQQVVIRLSNPDAQLNNEIRVQNEVAAISLMRDALSTYDSRIIPEVYGWNSAAEGQGWIVEEYMLGEPLNKAFATLSSDQQRDILAQLAQVFKMIQTYNLPSTITKYGGLAFNEKGEIVSGPIIFQWGGPFDAYEDLYREELKKQLEFAETTPLVDGWKSNPTLRRRLQTFLGSGVAKVLSVFSLTRPTLVHGDFDIQNILFDPKSNCLTAILDFDFTHIASPADEYLYSFPSFHGLLAGPFESDEMEALRVAQLNGFTTPAFALSEGQESEVNWELAKIWYEEIEKQAVLNPRTIEGIDELAALYWFLLDVSPPYFLMERWLGRKSMEEREEAKKEVEGNLEKYLKRWGF